MHVKEEVLSKLNFRIILNARMKNSLLSFALMGGHQIFSNFIKQRILYLLFFLLLVGSQLVFGQSCSSIAEYDASNRGGSGKYFTGENVRLSGGTSYYTPRFGSTTCNLNDSWCRDESAAGWLQWKLVGTCSTCASLDAGTIASNQTICANAAAWIICAFGF